jgi:very-short-patch-repair endonuclease
VNCGSFSGPRRWASSSAAKAAIGPYIVDFVCFAANLIIELDGPRHLDAAAQDYDQRRTVWLASQGLRVLRFRNHELDWDIRGVVQRIAEALED